MSDSAGRLLRLLGLLQRRMAWSGADLAERLGVDARTLDATWTGSGCSGTRLEAHLVPVAATAWGAARTSHRCCSKTTRRWLSRSCSASRRPLRFPVSSEGRSRPWPSSTACFHRDCAAQLTALRAATVPLVSRTEVVSTECLIQLAQACDNHQRVTFSYDAQDGRRSARRVEPHRLVATDRRWYLVAHDLERNDWRTFRVDRISELEVTGHIFVPRPLADPARMVAEGITTARYTHQAVVSVHAPFEDVVQLISPYTAVLEREDGHTRVQLGFDDLDWVTGYLIGLGLEFEVIEPLELRQYVSAVGERLNRVHTGPARVPQSGSSHRAGRAR